MTAILFVIAIVPGVHFEILQFALRQEIRGGDFDVRVLEVGCVYDLYGFEILHVFEGDREQYGPRVPVHWGDPNDSPLRSDALYRFGVHFRLWVDDLNVRQFERLLWLRLYD